MLDRQIRLIRGWLTVLADDEIRRHWFTRITCNRGGGRVNEWQAALRSREPDQRAAMIRELAAILGEQLCDFVDNPDDATTWPGSLIGAARHLERVGTRMRQLDIDENVPEWPAPVQAAIDAHDDRQRAERAAAARELPVEEAAGHDGREGGGAAAPAA